MFVVEDSGRSPVATMKTLKNNQVQVDFATDFWPCFSSISRKLAAHSWNLVLEEAVPTTHHTTFCQGHWFRISLIEKSLKWLSRSDTMLAAGKTRLDWFPCFTSFTCYKASSVVRWLLLVLDAIRYVAWQWSKTLLANTELCPRPEGYAIHAPTR